MTTTKTKASSKRRVIALADAELLLAQPQPMLDAILAKGEVSFAELEAILSLLGGKAERLMEDAIACFEHEAGVGQGDAWAILEGVAKAI